MAPKPLTLVLGLALFGLLLVGAKERLSVSASTDLVESVDCGERVAVGEKVSCSATLADDAFRGQSSSTWWSAPGGNPESGVGQAASSEWCSPEPNQVCGGGASAGFSTVFDKPGEKTITLRVCGKSGCEREPAEVEVSRR